MTFEKLITDHLPFAAGLARKMCAFVPPHITRDELVSAAYEGLIDAARKYDPDINQRFKTYAAIRIKGAILDELRNMDHLSRSFRRKTKDTSAACDWYNLLSIDTSVFDGGNATFKDFLEDADNNSIELFECDHTVRAWLSGLTKRERLIMYCYYWMDWPCKEIGSLLGRCESRIYQIWQKAIAKMNLMANQEDL